jgi:hypothetical protein
MPFRKMQRRKYPPRLWELRGYPGSGKSTFAAQMRAPILPIDADGRFAEVLHLVEGDAYQLSDEAADHTNVRRIADLLEANMVGSDVSTIVLDSLTTIIAPLVTKAIQANDAGENRNRVAAFKEKALAMRLLQDSLTRYGTDVLWIYHIHDGRDSKGNPVTRSTISETELARLMRSVNLKLEIVVAQGRRGIKVVWARRGRSGMVLWDETGCWREMPEKIEQAVYDGLSEEERQRLERGEPVVFPSPEVALAWAVESGAFDDEVHARNAYDKLKEEHQPRTAYEMAALWIGEVQRRAKGAQAQSPPIEAPVARMGSRQSRIAEPDEPYEMDLASNEPSGDMQSSVAAESDDSDEAAVVSNRRDGKLEGVARAGTEAEVAGPEAADTGPEAAVVSSQAASDDEVNGNIFWKRYYEYQRAGKLDNRARTQSPLKEAIDHQNWVEAWQTMHGLLVEPQTSS